MTTRKTHILEGRTLDEKKQPLFIMACGKQMKRMGITLYVGRALFMKGDFQSEVTCERCRKRYAKYVIADERTTPTADPAKS